MSARPVRRDEVPRFGSVWQWDADDKTYIALLVDGPTLVSLELPALEINRWMFWTHGTGETLSPWRCLDEGPE